MIGIDPRGVAVGPSKEEGIAADKFVRFQLEAPLLVAPSRGIAATHDIGFAVADGTGAGAAKLFERQKLFETVTPGERQFAATRGDGDEG
jgi:hypothetical protein